MIILTWSIESTHRSPFGGERIEIGTGELRIDGFFSHSHDFGLEVSTYPVERSQDISDHARPKLKNHEFQCFVSDQPYNPVLKEENHLEKTLIGVDYLIENAIPVDIETDRAFIEDFILLNRSGLRDASSGNGQEFSLSFQQLKIGEVELVDAPSPSIERARPQSNNGSQGTNETGSTDTAEGDRAALRSWLQSLRVAGRNSPGVRRIINAIIPGRSSGA